MSLRILLLCSACVILVVFLQAASQEQKELTARELLAEYERLAPINQALHNGHWVTKNQQYPKAVGRFNSRKLEKAFWCGDVCPQYGSVNIIYSDVKEVDCAAIGQPLYSNYWGRRYQGCSPLVRLDGSLVEHASSWSVAYFTNWDRSKPPIEEPLLFDDSSLCNKSGRKVSCSEFHNGQGVSILAIRSGNSLVVLKLAVTSNSPVATEDFGRRSRTLG